MDKKQGIIETGQRLFLQNGIGQTTMEQIAEAVPVSKMTIYKYFKSKEGLLEKILDQIIESMGGRMQQIIDQAKTPLDALTAMTRYESFYQDYSDFSEKFVKDLIAYYPNQSMRILNYQREHLFPKMEKLIFQAQQAGQVRKDLSPYNIMLFMAAMKEFFAKPELFNGLSNIYAVGAQVTSILFYGIVTEKAPDQTETKKDGE